MKKSRFGKKWIAIGAAVVAAIALILVFALPVGGREQAASIPVSAGSPAAPDPQGVDEATPNPDRKKPVPPPTRGTIKQTVKPVTAGPTKSGKFDEPVSPESEVTVRLVKTTSGVIEATGPGDTSGPVNVVTVSIENGSSKPINVDSATVALLYGQGGAMGTPTPEAPAQPFAGSIKPSETAQGTYVFRVPNQTQDKVTVLVTYTAGAAVAEFDGAVR